MSRSNDSQLCQWAGVVVSLGALGGIVAQAAPTVHRLSAAIPPAAHTITETDSGHRIHVEGFGALHKTGLPQLPARIFPIAVPPGAEVVHSPTAGVGRDVLGQGDDV